MKQTVKKQVLIYWRLPLSGEQINWLLDGYDITLLQGHKMLQYESVG